MSRVFLITSLAAAAFLACQTGPCLAEEKLPDGARADRVVVMKKERTLSLLVHGKILKTYKVALGGDPVGPKMKNGDHKTPEGIYVLDRRNEHSHYYRSLHISYPTAEDRARLRRQESNPAATSWFMVYRMVWVGSEASIAFGIGLTAVSLSQMKRWMRSGGLCQMEP
jgi:L,D-transpeptidase catalytic domain